MILRRRCVRDAVTRSPLWSRATVVSSSSSCLVPWQAPAEAAGVGGSGPSLRSARSSSRSCERDGVHVDGALRQALLACFVSCMMPPSSLLRTGGCCSGSRLRSGFNSTAPTRRPSLSTLFVLGDPRVPLRLSAVSGRRRHAHASGLCRHQRRVRAFVNFRRRGIVKVPADRRPVSIQWGRAATLANRRDQ